MFYKIRKLVARFLLPEYQAELDVLIQNAIDERRKIEEERKSIEQKISQRVAEMLAKMDPFEPLMKEYNVIFSKEYEQVEDGLNEQGKIGMYMWAWQQRNDIHFHHMIDWIMNKSGNSLLKKANPTELQTFYKRAEIANMILYRKEVGRLASNYEDMLNKSKPEEFDEGVGVEE